MSLGFDASESVVTVIGIEAVTDISPVCETAGPIVNDYRRALWAGGTNMYWSQGTLLVVLNPGHARILADEGYSRERLQETLFDEGAIPLAEMPHGNIPQGDWTVRDDRILITDHPESIYVMVAGGPEPLHSLYMTGFGVSEAASAPVWQPPRP